ncbi:MAG: cation:proton antiporter [Candidatus Aenigmatarchaeota archaeon]
MDVSVLLSIAVLLFFAKVFGEAAQRLKVDALAGEVLAGLVAGPVLMWVSPTPLLEGLASIGIILLVFLIGLSTRFDNMKGHVYSGSVLAIAACAASLAGGFAVGYFVLESIDAGVFLGIALMGTSTAIPIKILLERGEFQSRVGQFLVTASMADDIITIIGLSFLASYFSGTVSAWSSATLLFVILGFILAVVTVGAEAVDRFLSVVQRLKDEQILLSIPLAIVFAVTFFAENIGVASIVGAFLAGLAMAKSAFAETVIAPKVRTIGYGFFIPLFFAYSALVIDLGLLADYWWFIVLLTAAAVLTKVVSSWFVTARIGFRHRDRAIVVAGMIPRGECGIVVSQIALALGAITNEIYGSMVILVLITVIITPLLFSAVMSSWCGYRR